MLFSEVADFVVAHDELPPGLLELSKLAQVSIVYDVSDPEQLSNGKFDHRRSVDFAFCFDRGIAVWDIRFLATAGDGTPDKEFNPDIGVWFTEVMGRSLRAAEILNGLDQSRNITGELF